MPFNLLQKIEPENFPFKALQSNDGSGNLVAYASGSPGSGWTDPGTTYEGKTFLIEFLDYFVAVEYDGAAWVEKIKVPKITLYSTSEINTGLTDDNGNDIYCKTFNFGSDEISVLSIGGSAYETDIPKASILDVIDIKARVKTEIGTEQTYNINQNPLSASIVAAGFDNDFTNVVFYPLNDNAAITYKVTIYYTKN